jgi:metal transporter CNNM
MFNAICATVCVCTAALAAGLTMGLLSLDPLMLLIKQRAGATERERNDAESLLPIVRKHHLLLVSLLLMNAMANEALPLFLDKLVNPFVAVILSVTLVLFFGEIIPSAVFTGPDQIKIAARLAPVVRTVMFVLSPIAYPIAKVLDIVLHEEETEGMYNRGELSALVRIQYEEHLAAKSRRKSAIHRAIDEFSSMESLDSYASIRSSASRVRPEITQTIRSLKRELGQRNLHNDLHIDEVMMVEGALQMRTTPATEVFTPWSRVFAVPYDMVLNQPNMVKIYRSGYSRIPIYEKNPDDPDDNCRVRGILSSRQLMVVNSQDGRPVSHLRLATPRCVAPNTPLVDLVNMFQTGGVRGSHMALVCQRPDEANEVLKEGKALPDSVGLMGYVGNTCVFMMCLVKAAVPIANRTATPFAFK